jgi:hypothetical protein
VNGPAARPAARSAAHASQTALDDGCDAEQEEGRRPAVHRRKWRRAQAGEVGRLSAYDARPGNYAFSAPSVSGMPPPSYHSAMLSARRCATSRCVREVDRSCPSSRKRSFPGPGSKGPPEPARMPDLFSGPTPSPSQPCVSAPRPGPARAGDALDRSSPRHRRTQRPARPDRRPTVGRPDTPPRRRHRRPGPGRRPPSRGHRRRDRLRHA